MKNLTITGSVAYDYLMSFPGNFSEHFLEGKMETVSLSFLVDSMKKQRGGTAANIAYTLGLLGANPKMMATVGSDFVDYRAFLEKHNVDTSATITHEDDFLASFFVNTDLKQNQIASFYTGAMAYAKDLKFAELAADTSLAIISPNDPDAMRLYVEECKALDIPYIYDPSQQTVRLSGEDLKAGIDGCYLLTTNEYEFEMIQEKTGLSAEEIYKLAGGVLITSGDKGSTLTFGSEEHTMAVFPPNEVAEPTGAGDAYRAGMMRGIQLGLPWTVACNMGALAATYVLEQVGTQKHNFTIDEFIARYRAHQDDNGALDALKS